MAFDLSSVVKRKSDLPPKFVLYGPGGVGKTLLATHSQSPIFICAEEGLAKIEADHFQLREGDPLIRTWSELIWCLQQLLESDHEFKTVIIDSLDAAEKLCQSHVAEEAGKNCISEIGYGKGYDMTATEMDKMTSILNRLRSEKGMMPLIIGHADVEKYSPPDGESYDRYNVRCHKKVFDIVERWSDIICFYQFVTRIQKDNSGKTNERNRGVGKPDRVMFFDKRAAFTAKHRYSFPSEIRVKDSKEELKSTWEKVQSCINGEG